MLCSCSEIYCSGDLLHTIQMSQIFKDSKQFVDMKLKIPEEKIVKKFKELKKQHGGKPSPDVLKQFVEVSFHLLRIIFTFPRINQHLM